MSGKEYFKLKSRPFEKREGAATRKVKIVQRVRHPPAPWVNRR